MKSFELNGYWWLPSNPDNIIAGTLSFDPINGGFLSLLGSFQNFTKFGQVFDVDIILGFADGKKITLYHCYATGSNMSLTTGGPIALKSSFLVNIIILGHYFEKVDDIMFKSLSVNYSHLEDWTQISGFKFNLQSDKENHFNQYEVKYNFPQKFEMKIDDVLISFDYNFREGGDRIKEVRLLQTTFIKVEPLRECHLDTYLNNIFYHIQNFISLGVGKAVYPLIVKGKNENCKIELRKGRIVYNDIEVFYKARDFQEASKKLHPLDMVFFLGDVRDELEKYLNNWFKKAELIQPVYDLYFATLYSPKMYLQHKFLSLIQALEVYHRRVYGGKYISDENYKEVYTKLVEAIPSELEDSFKSSLKGKMNYLHEYSLRKRLKVITDTLDDVIEILIKNKVDFISDVENTRNFLTHYDRNLEDKCKTGNDLYILTQKVKFILEMCFLLEMGMSTDKIKKLAKRNQRYQYLAKNV